MPTKLLTRKQANRALMVLTLEAAALLRSEALKLFDTLTDDEIEAMQGVSIESRDGPMLYRLPKILMIAVADSIESQFMAETFKPELRRLRKIRKTRP